MTFSTPTAIATSYAPEATAYDAWRSASDPVAQKFSTRVTDTSLAAIAGHPALTELFLQCTGVTKEGIKHVPSLTALLKLTTVSHVTYGTDYPYFELDQAKDLSKLGLSAADITAIESGNAMKLVPTLKA